MATSVNTSLPIWLAGCTYDATGGNDLRNSAITAFFYDPGVVAGATIGVRGGVVGGAGLAVSAGTGMSVLVQPGSFVVPNSGTPTAGGYAATLVSQATLAVQAADPSLPRNDIVVAYVSDVGTSSSFGAVEIITGTPSLVPVQPAAPANSITLAVITVPAGATSIVSGNIGDQRPYTTTTGGVLIANKYTVNGYAGQLAYDPPSGSFYNNNGTASGTQMRVLPWQPVITTSSTAFTWSGAETTVLQETITTDGYTDIEIAFKWPGVSSSRGASYTFNVAFRMYIDSTQVDALYTPNDPADSVAHSGGSWSYYTSPATGDTPASGTHTVKVTAQNQSGSYSTSVYGLSNSKIILRVEPVAV